MIQKCVLKKSSTQITQITISGLKISRGALLRIGANLTPAQQINPMKACDCGL
jgi:hypothetical protein